MRRSLLCAVCLIGLAVPSHALAASLPPSAHAVQVIGKYERLWLEVRNDTAWSPGQNLFTSGASLPAIEADIPVLQQMVDHPQPETPTPVSSSSSSSSQGGGGGWAIPAYIVQCESGGVNLAPNEASAAGYYQITLETWLANGGGQFADEADHATLAQQGQVASNIAATTGLGAWDCAH